MVTQLRIWAKGCAHGEFEVESWGAMLIGVGSPCKKSWLRMSTFSRQGRQMTRALTGQAAASASTRIVRIIDGRSCSVKCGQVQYQCHTSIFSLGVEIQLQPIHCYPQVTLVLRTLLRKVGCEATFSRIAFDNGNLTRPRNNALINVPQPWNTRVGLLLDLRDVTDQPHSTSCVCCAKFW